MFLIQVNQRHPWKSVVKLTDRPDMTVVGYHGCKQQHNKKSKGNYFGTCFHSSVVLIGVSLHCRDDSIVEQTSNGE